jgi:4-hydroxy-tetrahydrodipicolinate synthase
MLKAMRMMKEMSQIEEKLSSGELSLTNVAKAQEFFNQEAKLEGLASEEKLEVLEKLVNKSTREAEKIGVHGAMLVGPYYNKPPQEGFYQHFTAIAAQTELPLILYNVPGRTGSNILPATVARLAEIKNIVAVKEASGNMEQVSEILRTAPKNFLVYSGDDSLTLPILSVGGTGIISVAAHIIGKHMQEMVKAFLEHDIVRAQAIHLKLMPFFKVIFVTTNPIPIKAAVNLIGQNAGPLRLPLIPPTAAELDQIKKVMNQIGVL